MMTENQPDHSPEAQALPKERRLLPVVRWASPLVLLLGLVTTYFTWDSVHSHAAQMQQSEFDFKAQEIHSRIRERLEDYRILLLGATGLFVASQSVERNEFQAYVATLHLQDSFPGIQGLGFAQVISPGDKARRTAAIRKEGFPQFAIRPEGARALYTAIIYLEPFDWRNQRAFGYDMYSEPVRREAMERARDRGEGAISGKVTLVQETEQDMQHGFLMYLPVYRNGAPHATLEERRTHLLGWVYSPFRMNDLMTKGILGRYLDDIRGKLDIEIYDGREIGPQHLMFDLLPSPQGSSTGNSRFFSRQTAHHLGHDWTIVIRSLPAAEAQPHDREAFIVALAGTIISLLITLVVWLLSSTNLRAIQLAEKMSASLAASARYTRSLIEASLDPLVTINPQGRITDVNEATVHVTGHLRNELIGREFSGYFTDPEKAREGYRQVFSQGQVTDYPLTIRHQDGHLTDVLYNASVFRDEAGNVRGVLAAARDVTQRVRAEKALYASREKLKQTLTETIKAMSTIVEMRDPYTAGHQRRAAHLAQAIAREIQLPQERIEALNLAALAYEIGKIRVPSEILCKPSQLDEMERELIQNHADAGFEILREIDFPWPIAQIVRQHHERMDGSGYPQGLKGEAILLEARIIAVADVVEAMLSHRPYRPALGLQAALEEISSKRGLLYDPQVVDACLRLFTEQHYSLPS